MGSVVWGREIAEIYDSEESGVFSHEVVGPTVDFLADLAGDGPALELAIGTGRIGLPLSRRVPVHGVELSPHMAAVLQRKEGADAIPVTIGDMATTRLDATFTLVYLVFNTIMNLTSQDEQVMVFENAFAHLCPGGRFVVEVIVPQVRRVPIGGLGHIFTVEPDHIGIETFDDPLRQIAWSHHWMVNDGELVRHATPYRYVWPSEMDLMARIAGFDLEGRWADWDRSEFTDESSSQLAVYLKPGS